MVRDLIEDNERKYGGTADAPTYEEIAKNVAGIAYAGELGQHAFTNATTYAPLAGSDTVRIGHKHCLASRKAEFVLRRQIYRNSSW